MIPVCLPWRALWIPAGFSSWAWGILLSLQAACAHVQAPVCPRGRAFGVSLRKELGRFYPLDIPTATDGIVRRCVRSQVYPQACKRVCRACARLLLGMPAVLPYSRVICASPGCGWSKVMSITKRIRNTQTFFFVPTLVFQLMGLWCSKYSQYEMQERTFVHGSLRVYLPAWI